MNSHLSYVPESTGHHYAEQANDNETEESQPGPSQPPMGSRPSSNTSYPTWAAQFHTTNNPYIPSVNHQDFLQPTFDALGHGQCSATETQQPGQHPLFMNPNAQLVSGPVQAANPFFSMGPSLPDSMLPKVTMPSIPLTQAFVGHSSQLQAAHRRGMSQPWSQAQDDMLLTLKAEGKTHPEISREIWKSFGVLRTPNVLAKRLAKLNNAVLSRDVSRPTCFGDENVPSHMSNTPADLLTMRERLGCGIVYCHRFTVSPHHD